MRATVLITGASAGLGAEMARQLAARGCHLALCARRGERLEALRVELAERHPGVRVAVRTLDVDDHAAVFAAFRDLDAELGGLDRVVVNAGLGKGARLGTGRFDVNKQTATTNFVSALAQCEAAMELFHAHGAGHLVVVASVQAMRGMPGPMATYAASKAGVASLAEGIRSDVLGTPIKVTTLFPGYIRSEMNERIAHRAPFMVDTETGVRSMLKAIDKEVATTEIPPWPWKPIGFVLRHAPLRLVRKLV